MRKIRVCYVTILIIFLLVLVSQVSAETSIAYWTREYCRYSAGGGGYACDSGQVANSNTASCQASVSNGQCAEEGDVYCYAESNCELYGNSYAGPTNAYNVNWDARQADCDCKMGAGRWYLGGEIDPYACCGDEAGQYKITRVGGTDAPTGYTTDANDDACCNANNKCSKDSGCVASTQTDGTPPTKAYCNAGTWEGGDAGSTQCDAIVGSGYWSIGGIGDPTGCCADDLSEARITETSGTDAPSPYNDNTGTTCCNASTDCTESGNDICTPALNTSGTAPNRAWCGPGTTWYGGDYNQTACDAIVGTLRWNIGGEVDASACCSDDANQYKRTRVCSAGCSSDPNDDACCDVNTDCVYNSQCYSSGANSWATGNIMIHCNAGTWERPPWYTINETYMIDYLPLVLHNSRPLIINLVITPSPAYTNSTLNCSANYVDAEADKGNVTITWYNGSTQYGKITVLNVANGMMVSNSTPIGIQAKNEIWNCTMNATDANGTIGRPNSVTSLIGNYRPEVQGINILPKTPSTSSDLECSFTTIDIDLDKINATVRWYNDSRLALTKTLNNDYANSTTVKSNLTSGNLSAGDTWNCEVWLYDNIVNSTLANSSSVFVASLGGCANITKPGKYNLTSAITNWAGPAGEVCINITASDVEIDCVGWNYWIDGQDTSDTVGIKAEGTSSNKLKNVSIKNCNLTDWYYGDYYRYTENSTIQNTSSSNSNIGIYLDSSSINNLTQITATNNVWEGIYLYSSSNYNNITNINVSSNTDTGILLEYNSNYNIIANLTSSANTRNGVWIQTSSFNDIMNVTALANNEIGLFLFASSYNEIFNSTFQSNKRWGAYLNMSRYNNLSSLRIENNSVSGYSGIFIWSDASDSNSNSSFNRIWNNLINNTPNGGLNWKTYGINYTSYFNTTKTAGTNIVGKPWIAGNYWSDYTGNDMDGDYIGNTPYVINSTAGPIQASNMTDALPLTLTVAYDYNISVCRNITQSGKYTLNRSITNWGAPQYSACINITASDVEIDCVGSNYWIDGNDTSNTIGIKAEGISSNKLTNVSVKNCNMTDWYRGIYYNYAQNSSIKNITFFSNSVYGIYLSYSSNNNLTSINASGNSQDIYMSQSSNNYFNNINTSGDSIGIYLASTSQNNTLKNIITNLNQNYGIEIYSNSNNNTFTNITASGNWNYGIHSQQSSNNIFTNINTSMNGQVGVYLFYSSNKNQIINSTIQSNRQYGVYISNSTLNNITGCTISNNSVSGYGGIRIESDIVYPSTSNSSYNRFWNNIINNTPNGGRDWKTSGENYTNYFNTTKTIGTNIIGGSWIAGNYWSDYSGADEDGDGIGDTEYIINTTYMNDSLPLVFTYPPTITNIAITPDPAYTNSTLNCSAAYNDGNSNKGNVTIYWYNGSAGTNLFSSTTFKNINNGNMVSLELRTFMNGIAGNMSDGFRIAGFGSSLSSGMASNGSDFWITDNTDDFVYHVTASGGVASNKSDGFSIRNATVGAESPNGIATNSSDFWIADNVDDFVYHVTASNGVATNYSDGFSINATVGAAAPVGITTNGSDFWIADVTDDFVYHVKPDGAGGVTNYSDGFRIAGIGSSSSSSITTNGSDFWISDDGDDFVYHVTASGGVASNKSDGFRIGGFGSGTSTGISSNIFGGGGSAYWDVATGFWIGDSGDDFVYHLMGQEGIQAKGETWNCTINATDSTEEIGLPNSTTITISNLAPSTPSLALPVNNTNLSDSTPTFNWSTTDSDNDTLTYELYIDDNPDFSSLSVNKTGISQNYTLGMAEALSNGTYYWKVRAYDGTGRSSWSPAWKFGINTIKPTVTLNQPQNYLNTSSTSITFNCTAYDDWGIVNVSLYGNWSGVWHRVATNTSGLNNSNYIFNINLATDYQNQSDGFRIAGIGSADSYGITTNGTDFWIIDRADDFVYHTNRTGGNMTDGFKTTAFGYADPLGITTNGSDFWIADISDFVYHVKPDGLGGATNFSDGFNTSAFGSTVPVGITTNGSDFWITDNTDDFVYHVKPDGLGGATNFSDGFRIAGFGAANPYIITTNGSDFWITDPTDVLVYHVKPDGLGGATNFSDGFSTTTFSSGAPYGITSIPVGYDSSQWNVPTDFWITDNGDDFVYHLRSQLSDGQFIWNCLAYDSSNNFGWGTSNWTFTVDTNSPDVTLQAPANESTETSTNDIDFIYNATDTLTGIVNCSLYLNGTLNNTNTTVNLGQNNSIRVNGLANDKYNWTVKCYDYVNNFNSSGNFTFTLNTNQPPTITNVTITPNPAYSDSILNCSATYNDPDSDKGNVTIYWYNDSAGTNLFSTTTIWDVNSNSLVSFELRTFMNGIAENMSDGFSTSTGIGAADARGITTNGSDFWINDRTDDFMYHINRAGGNCTGTLCEAGFSIAGIGADNSDGITTNGSDFWILDIVDGFAYHVNRTGGNMSDGFGNSSKLTGGAAFDTAYGITTNGSDFWINDDNDNFVYHVNRTGGNMSDGFKSSTGIGGDTPEAITTNGSDFWITDYDDDFVYHVNRTGGNMSDGFKSSTGIGGDAPEGITSIPIGYDSSQWNVVTDFWILDGGGGDDFVYHIKGAGGIQAKGETWNCTINATDAQEAGLPNSTTVTIVNAVPYFQINYPLNASSFSNITVQLNATVYEADNENMDVWIYVANNTKWFNTSLVYINSSMKNAYEAVYNLTALPIQPGANTTLLFHFDNRSDFGENDTTIYDFSLSKNNGTVTCQGAACAKPKWNQTGGKFGGAFEFTGDDLINLSDPSLFDTGQGQVTFEFWFKLSSSFTSSSVGIQPLLAKYEVANDDFYIALYGTEGTSATPADGSLTLKYEDGGTSLYAWTQTTSWAANTWYHVVINRSGSEADIWVNGVKDDVVGTGVNPNANNIAGDLLIGGGRIDQAPTGGDWRYFNGTVDEVAVYNRSLSTYEIRDHYILNKQKYYWKVNASDGIVENSSLIYEFTRANAAPTSNYVTITPSPAYTNSTLNCSAVFNDVDLDSLTVNFTWYNGSAYYNSSTFSASSGQLRSLSLSAGIQAIGETWNCSVFANDGTDNSALNSTTITIVNAVPYFQINYPPNASSFSNITVQLNATVYDSDNDNMDVWIYVANNTKWFNTSLVYINSSMKNAYEAIYNLTALPIQPDSSSVLLMHFDNRSEFGENSTTAYDFSGQGNNGSIKGGTKWNSTGKFGGALEFDGTADNVTIQDSAELGVQVNFTIIAWFNDRSVQNDRILEKGDCYFFLTDQNTNGCTTVGRMQFLIKESNVIYCVETTSNPSRNEWHMVAGVKNDSDILIYLDGVYQGATAVSGNIDDDDLPLYIGSDDSASSDFIGAMDEVAIYNRLLSAQDINDFYILSKQKYYWKVNASDGTVENSSGTYEFTRANAVPTSAYVTITPSPAYTNSTLTCSAVFNDVDLDSLTVNFTWYNGSAYYNSSTFSATSGQVRSLSLSAGIQAKGETWNCSVFANDGTDNSALNSTTITIVNAVPYFKINYPLNASSFSNITVQLNATVYEADNENMDVWIYVANNTKYLNTSLVFVNSTVKNAQEIIYNLTALPIQPDANTTLLLHFDNRSEFGENDTTIYDFSQGKNNGSVQGLARWNATGGKFGGGFWFNGSNYITVNDSGGVLNRSGPFSVAVWVYVTSYDTWDKVISKGENTWGLEARTTNGNFGFNVYDTTWQVAECGPYATNRWVFLVGVYTGSTLFCLVNGQGATTNDSASFVNAPSAYNLSIARNAQTGAQYFTGAIDEVVIWNRSLTVKEIQDLYILGKQKYYWKVNASDGIDENSSGTYEFTRTNAVPTSTYVTITPNPAYTDSTLDCSAVFNDVDFDSLTVNFTWYNGSAYYNSSTFSASSGQVSSLSLSAGIQALGETWNCSVFANDGTDNSALNSTTRTISNTPPLISAITIAPNPAYTNSTLNCSGTYSDADADKGNVSITWYNGSTLYGRITVLNLVTGQLLSNSTPAGIQVKNEIWNCTMNATDAQGNAGVSVSTTRTISNMPPTNVTLYRPLKGEHISDRKPNTTWYNANDIDNDVLTYWVQVDEDPLFTSPEVNGVNQSNINQTATFTNWTALNDLNIIYSPYYWRVKTFDGVDWSGWSDAWNFSIDSVAIILVNNSVNFSTMSVRQTENTTDDIPNPFLMQNIGNVFLNVSTYAENSLWKQAPSPTDKFRFKAANSTKLNTFNWALSITQWTNVPLTGLVTVSRLNYNSSNDTAELEIEVTVPGDEPPGNKNTTIMFEASQA